MNTDTQEVIDRLNEIKEQFHELLDEADELIQNSSEHLTYERARSYWLAHIRCALDNEHMYLGGSMMTMQDTINEMSGVEEDDAA